MIDKKAERILERMPRAASPNPYDYPKLGMNAIVYLDTAGRLVILGDFGVLTIDEDDLDVLDSDVS